VSDPLAPVRYLDVALVLLAAPFVVLLDLPALGYVVGAGAWLLARVIEVGLERRASHSQLRGALGLKFASMLGRTWLIGIAIVVVGVAAERHDGFVAAVVCLIAYTIHLATQLILRPFDSKRA
jgi:hypothetical protein